MAGSIGIGIVILFMLFYYRLPGLLADIVLILYACLTFAVFKIIGVTMSLAGITGFILSIGMAVDANVLILSASKKKSVLVGCLHLQLILGGVVLGPRSETQTVRR